MLKVSDLRLRAAHGPLRDSLLPALRLVRDDRKTRSRIRQEAAKAELDALTEGGRLIEVRVVDRAVLHGQ